MKANDGVDGAAKRRRDDGVGVVDGVGWGKMR